MLIDRLRSTLHSAITSDAGNGLSLVRASKNVARRINVTLGSPLGSADELTKRNAATARLAALRNAPRSAVAEASPAPHAPVTVYFEGVRNARLLSRVVELPDAKSIA